MAVISPGSGNTALEITITNHGGDDAHLAQLVANFPESLPLSSVILKQDSVSLRNKHNSIQMNAIKMIMLT